MLCPICEAKGLTRILADRPSVFQAIRVKECDKCGYKTTYKIHNTNAPNIQQQDVNPS